MPTLNWIGKEAVVRHHAEVPFRLLEEVPERSCPPADGDTENLIVQGDNLEALKALLPRYAGQVKCIYIDPPYNTGNEGWVYNDAVNSPEIRQWLRQTVGKEGEDLSRHDKWLCMMYPRLVLLRQFLTEDGLILISIDDFEVTNLRNLMNEIFGVQNFVAQMIWEKGRKNDAKLFSAGHEYIVIYANSASVLRERKIRFRKEKAGAAEIYAEFQNLRERLGEQYPLIEQGLRGFYKALPRSHPSKKHMRYNKVDQHGVWRDDNMSWPGGGGPRYEVIHPVTNKPCAIPDGGWRYATAEKMAEMIRRGKVIFRADHTEPPIRKTYLVRDLEEEDEEEEENIGREVLGTYFYRSALQASNELTSIFGQKVFENPKDHVIVAGLIDYVTRHDRNAIILDSFAGSGTTGHSVLALNKRDRGKRRFVLVELDEKIVREITTERVRRVAHGYINPKGEAVPGLGDGFHFARLGKPLFDETGAIRSDVKFAELAEFVFFKETGRPLPCRAGASPAAGKGNGKRGACPTKLSALLGVHEGRAVYLLFNGILGDRRVDGGNVLTSPVLAELPAHAGPKVIYAAACRLGRARLEKEQIAFKQTPWELHIE